jgi:hypothetical protein
MSAGEFGAQKKRIRAVREALPARDDLRDEYLFARPIPTCRKLSPPGTDGGTPLPPARRNQQRRRPYASSWHRPRGGCRSRGLRPGSRPSPDPLQAGIPRLHLQFDLRSVEDIDRSWMGIYKMPIGPSGCSIRSVSIPSRRSWAIGPRH